MQKKYLQTNLFKKIYFLLNNFIYHHFMKNNFILLIMLFIINTKVLSEKKQLKPISSINKDQNLVKIFNHKISDSIDAISVSLRYHGYEYSLIKKNDQNKDYISIIFEINNDNIKNFVIKYKENEYYYNVSKDSKEFLKIFLKNNLKEILCCFLYFGDTSNVNTKKNKLKITIKNQTYHINVQGDFVQITQSIDNNDVVLIKAKKCEIKEKSNSLEVKKEKSNKDSQTFYNLEKTEIRISKNSSTLEKEIPKEKKENLEREFMEKVMYEKTTTKKNYKKSENQEFNDIPKSKENNQKSEKDKNNNSNFSSNNDCQNDPIKKALLYFGYSDISQCEFNVLKKEYHQKCLKLHPDKNINNREEAEKQFKELKENYENLIKIIN